ncbi:Type 1 phosphatases regulator ypi1 [Vermiconidia calcicola]|uniref:Type 1 phosphatases regulator ypi1 n=1 Tax=Vermiconidia calcicola TaxID=1690605 RepID=A0ACC3MFD1_9PEZI|nr:Type 1 phosphatases regulator ypi1 [Vermiconidia calcicola]
MSSHPRTSTRQAGSSGTATPTATHGSQTILSTDAGPSIPIPALRLRAEQPEPRRRIQWAQDVVDNEGMGKKSSKVCCIYHKPHEPGDSDEDESSGSDESDGEPDLSRAQAAGGGRGRREDAGKGKGKERKASPNAYERQPKQKGKQDG